MKLFIIVCQSLVKFCKYITGSSTEENPEIYIAKKVIAVNAVAFLKCKGGQLFVDGKFYDEHKSFGGPREFLNIEIPQNLLTEIKQRQTWRAPKSLELTEFCKKAYEQVGKQNSWFTSKI